MKFWSLLHDSLLSGHLGVTKTINKYENDSIGQIICPIPGDGMNDVKCVKNVNPLPNQLEKLWHNTMLVHP